MTVVVGTLNGKPLASGRLMALDGLRGAAAMVVVVYHYLLMTHPNFSPRYTNQPHPVVDTPLAVFINGQFAVMVFFALSGFVIAGAAARRGDKLMINVVTRYLRLAVPVVASVLLALMWLSLFPATTAELAASLEAPSAWLQNTVQHDLPSVWTALWHGQVEVFMTGSSQINNVLWTMKIEFFGSIGLFTAYWLGRNSTALRFLALAALAVLAVFVIPDAYLCFVTGALLFEAYRKGLLVYLPPWTAIAALVLGVVLGAPGSGFADRIGLDMLPYRLQPGAVRGPISVLAATLLVFAALRLTAFATLLSNALLQWMGRASFSLYLVHVPLLYTVVAWMHLHLGQPGFVPFLLYILLTCAVAQVFTVTVDEPSLKLLRRLRRYLEHLSAQYRPPQVLRKPSSQARDVCECQGRLHDLHENQ